MCLLLNYEHLLDPGMWRLQMCLLFNYEHLLDLDMWRLQMGLLFNYERLLDTRHDCDVYKCVCCLTMNVYLTLAWLWRLQMCLLFNYERLLDTRHDCDVYKCACCLTMNVYLTLACDVYKVMLTRRLQSLRRIHLWPWRSYSHPDSEAPCRQRNCNGDLRNRSTGRLLEV